MFKNMFAIKKREPYVKHVFINVCVSYVKHIINIYLWQLNDHHTFINICFFTFISFLYLLIFVLFWGLPTQTFITYVLCLFKNEYVFKHFYHLVYGWYTSLFWTTLFNWLSIFTQHWISKRMLLICSSIHLMKKYMLFLLLQIAFLDKVVTPLWMVLTNCIFKCFWKEERM